MEIWMPRFDKADVESVDLENWTPWLDQWGGCPEEWYIYIYILYMSDEKVPPHRCRYIYIYHSELLERAMEREICISLLNTVPKHVFFSQARGITMKRWYVYKPRVYSLVIWHSHGKWPICRWFPSYKPPFMVGIFLGYVSHNHY